MSRINFNVTSSQPIKFGLVDSPTINFSAGARQGPAGPGTGGSVDWQEIYLRTTDPGIAGQPWNSGGFLVFSDGVSAASLDFSNLNNSMYLALLIEEL